MHKMQFLGISLSIIFYFFLSAVLCTEEDDDMLPRIGIIGAGIGGTSSAYFLRQLFGEKATIDIFEAEKVGGRTAVIKINGLNYEAGGSVIHTKNKYMVKFAEKFNKSALTHSDSFLGLYDNKGIVFETSKWAPIALAKLIWRYGFDLYTIREWTKNLVASKFDRIYEFQDKGMAFTTVDDMLRAMSEDFLNMTQHSLRDVLREVGVSQRFVDELAMAAMRANYGQTVDVHGFVGAVSLLGAEPGLWSVVNGNKEISEDLLKESKASFIEAKVLSVALMKDERGTGNIAYEVEYEETHPDKKDKTNSKEYDIVIVAAPLEGSKSKISFVDFTNPLPSISQKYHTTIAMFVQGCINKTTFNVNSQGDFPPDMLTVSPDVFFNSVGLLSSVNPEKQPDVAPEADQAVWKTFLNKVPSEEQISILFESRQDLRFVEWLAYPEYSPNMKLPPFQLYDRLYYINAVESAASAMEMSVIGSRNVALLAFNQWFNHFDKIDEIHLPVPASKTEKDNSEL
ncbi:unnamed protein product [Lymnaea stagnalis]|uniref:Prenylcysteine lyase domain-containing protein n=1 Tax=Lymnaea stagnalis TaxID=6523 RepID=A0AAV2HER5_LYMST